MPPPDEQRQIVEHVNLKTQAIDDLMAFVVNEINLLRELRASAITEAVLGKIQVGT